jgi:hypothetical protein
MDTDIDLSQYQVTLTTTMLGWTWRAKAPTGEAIRRDGLNLYATKAEAEAGALKAITRHARPPESIDGNALRDRVRSDRR